MPEAPARQPQQVRDKVRRVSDLLDEVVPAKQVEHNLLVATWNLREFGEVSPAWRAGASASPKRDWGSVAAIAEIVSRFDVVALQEVQGRIGALRQLLRFLGDQWGLLLTDVNRGHKGGNERMAFVFDTARVRPSGLAAEIVLPEEWRGQKIGDAVLGQFARTPYAVSFLTHGRSVRQTLILVTVHVWYGKAARERTGEIAALARWMADWADDLSDFNQNLMVLGDFNIDRADDPNYRALVGTGLQVPPELQGLRRTIFDEADGSHHHYDQIAWFAGAGGKEPALSLRYTGRAGIVDFVPAMGARDKQDLSYRMSDHYPLWAEFAVR